MMPHKKVSVIVLGGPLLSSGCDLNADAPEVRINVAEVEELSTNLFRN